MELQPPETKPDLARTLTVVMPALNEEHNIGLTVNEILPIARRELAGIELILVNDGSSDKTGEAMDRLAAENPEVTVIHHPECRGVGATYKEGIARARMNYVTLVPGDHEADAATWPAFFQAVGKADLVIGYRANQRVARPLYRVFLSRLYTFIMCRLFGVRVRDFHSLVVYPTGSVRTRELGFVGYTYQLELLVNLFRNRFTYTEVAVILLPVQHAQQPVAEFPNVLRYRGHDPAAVDGPAGGENGEKTWPKRAIAFFLRRRRIGSGQEFAAEHPSDLLARAAALRGAPVSLRRGTGLAALARTCSISRCGATCGARSASTGEGIGSRNSRPTNGSRSSIK